MGHNFAHPPEGRPGSRQCRQSPERDTQSYRSALAKQNSCRQVISAYQGHLESELTTSRKRIKAAHALASPDLARQSTMAAAGARQTDAMLKESEAKTGGINAPKDPNSPAIEPDSEEVDLGMLDDEGNPIKGPFYKEWKGSDPLSVPLPGKDFVNLGAAWNQGTPDKNPENNNKFWADLKDCVPCGLNGSWLAGTKGELGSFEELWGDLLDILEADMNMRISIFSDLEAVFEGNDVLEALCQLLAMLKNLCPQDLISIVVLLTTYINKILADIQINMAGLLQGILSGILRPFITGLQAFLNGIFGIFLDELECIMNLIIAASDATAATLEFLNRDTAGGGVEAMGARKAGKAMRQFVDDANRAGANVSRFIAKDLPKAITDMMREAIAFLEKGIVELTSAIFDVLRMDWLKSNSQIGFLGNLKSVATILNIIQTLIELHHSGWSLEELCGDEKQILNLLDELNEDSPNRIVNTDPRNTGPSGEESTTTPLSLFPDILKDYGPEFKIPDNKRPTTERSGASAPLKQASGSISFSLKDCMKKPAKADADIFNKWIEELGG